MEITVRCSQLFPILQLQQIFRNCKMLVNLNYHEVGNKKKLTILCIYTYVDCNLEYVFAKNGQGYERTLISLYFDSFFFFATSAMLSQGQVSILYTYFFQFTTTKSSFSQVALFFFCIPMPNKRSHNGMKSFLMQHLTFFPEYFRVIQ